MTVAVCAPAREQRQICAELAGSHPDWQLESFALREELLYRMKETRFDAVFVAMPGALGMETVIGVRALDADTALIWASDQQEFIPESYRLRVQMFLLLPLAPGQAAAALEPEQERGKQA